MRGSRATRYGADCAVHPVIVSAVVRPDDRSPVLGSLGARTLEDFEIYYKILRRSFTRIIAHFAVHYSRPRPHDPVVGDGD